MAIISPVDLSAVRIDELPDFDPHSQVGVSLLRLDLLHPLVSGNKWFKLSENLKEARALGYRRILSFGGAYSNHLIATAAAAQANGFESIGVVRGEEFAQNLNPVLQACKQMGMSLHFVSRSDYDHTDVCLAAIPEHPTYYLIPEGGANELGRAGMSAMASFIPDTYDLVAISVGSGTSFEGLRNYLPPTQQLLGFVPMKGGAYLESSIRSHLNNKEAANWSLTDAFAMGGFGKCPPELQRFMQEFRDRYGIETDRVYTAKMMFGLQSMLRQSYFPKGTRILGIHTGGLSGNWSKA